MHRRKVSRCRYVLFSVASVVSNSLQSMGCNPPGSSVHGIFQAKTLEWVAMPSSRGSSQPRDRTHILYHWAIREAHIKVVRMSGFRSACNYRMVVRILRLCNPPRAFHVDSLRPVNCSLLASSVHGILQAKTLEWVAMLSSRGSYRPRNQTHVSYHLCIGKWVLCHYCHVETEG